MTITRTMKTILSIASLLLLPALTSCQTPTQSSFPDNPTDSGSRYSEFNMPGSRMAGQNTDLED